MRPQWYVLIAVCLVVPTGWCAPSATLRTARIEMVLDGGVVKRLTNRIVHETFDARSAAALTGIRHLRAGELWNDRAELQQKADVSGVALSLRWRSADSTSRLATRYSALASGEIVVQQEAECAQPGLVGLQWGMVLPDSCDLLVPTFSGLRLAADTYFEPMRLEYPTTWEAQFVLVQGKRGGFLIHAEDNAKRFKRLFIVHRGGQFWLGFETWCTAPFDRIQRDTSVRWRIRAYKGSWLVGVSLYRQWAAKQFGLANLRKLQPTWVRDIQAVVIDNLDDPVRLEAIARRLNPKQTLIYVPDWRKDGYDRNYPDYTPRADFAERMERARRLGFRIMLHVNYFGVTPENPAYEQLKGYHIRDPFTGEYLYWDWSRVEPPIKFAYVNPASGQWRRLFIQRMVALYRQLKPDALHLDQTLVTPNDGNGVFDGMNTMQGNIALHAELQRALPQVALSGEGLNEVTFRYESFAQRHVWGINPADANWDIWNVRMAHPVSSALLTPHTKLYGYLGMPSPHLWHYYTAWRTSYERLGVLPTFAWMPTRMCTDPDRGIQMLWNEARWFQINRPVPEFVPSIWTSDTLFAYRTASGQIARYRSEPTGVRLEVGSGNGAKVVYRRVEGVSTARVPGSIPGWLAYNGRELLALDPQYSYPWIPDSPNLRVLHIHAAPGTVSVKGASQKAGVWARFALQAVEAPFAELWRGGLSVSSRVNDPQGSGRGSAGFLVDDDSGAMARPVGAGIFMHPPWRSKAGGDVWLEYTLRLPRSRACRFVSGVGFTAIDAARRSDGITFTVTARGESATLSAQRHVHGTVPEEITLDLSPLRGQRIHLRLQAHPGPKGSPEFDWGLWSRPRIVLSHSEAQSVEVYSPKPVRYAFVDGELQSAQATTPGRYRFTLPGQQSALVLLQTEPDSVSVPANLAALSFDTGLELDGLASEPFDDLRGVVGQGVCGGVLKDGFSAHPPPYGRTYLTFVLRLPPEEVYLRGSAGIRDGAEGKSNGVRFVVEVNGREVWNRTVKPGEGWVPFEVSLAEWAGQPLLLRFVTDSLGDFGWDWAHWGDLQIE